ncbi:RNA-binding protein 44 isoform X2 [Xyrichtys novacula]|uniref:RNA-binding protein 44 isoform X2 n=1 Tax=Xyrichtys novacula TaxID=13765 RepID=A0AAV1H0T1_XYRNO|nr:RNA-binding protein 44 isoform X2 [Xyrichtys novacula]
MLRQSTSMCEENELPGHLRETLRLLDCSNDRDGPQKILHKPLVQLQDSFQTAHSYPSARDSNHQQAPEGPSLYNLNEEGASWHMAPSSSTALCKGPAPLACFSVDMKLKNQQERPELRSQTAVTQGQSANSSYTDVILFQSEWAKFENNTPSKHYGFHNVQMDSVEYTYSRINHLTEVKELDSKEVRRDLLVNSTERAMDENAAIVNCGESRNYLYSVMKDDQSILACLPSEETKAVAGISESSKSHQSSMKMSPAGSFTSTPRPLTTWDVKVETEPAQHMSTSTQTEAPETSDKHVITEVHMADLDYVAEEFLKLKAAKEELRELKAKMKRLKNPPENILSVLQNLETGFSQLRDMIMAGVPLKQMEPLSVNCEKISTEVSSIPAQISDDVLRNVPPGSSQKTPTHKTSGEDKGCTDSQSRDSCQEKDKETKKESRKPTRAVTLLQNPPKLEEKQSISCKEPHTSEAWYDAEENLELPGPEAAPVGQDATGLPSEEVEISVLFVSNLPSHVAKSDVILWFEKYNVLEVSLSDLKNGLRVAIVTTSGSQSAKEAVRDLNGCNMQGHTLHVEHIIRPTGGNQSQALDPVSGPESAQAKKPRTSNTESSKTERELIAQPLLSSSMKNRKVSCTPTVRGTCVPQHYCTLGGFETLMAELTQRHPDVSRQRIIDALSELKAKHGGVLISLPLSTIRDMMSELLIQPATTTQR